MTNDSPLLDIAPPQIVIVAKGDTRGAQSYSKGHLFEKFVAKLFQAYGCVEPTTINLNVKSNGYEVDLVTKFSLSGARVMAECKAYQSPLPVGDLGIFHSKLVTERFSHPDTSGWFVAIPGLTSDAYQWSRKIQENDPKFRLLTATEIYKLVLDKGWISEIQQLDGIVISDHAILVTETGVCAMAKQLDSASRLPTGILLKRQGGIVSQEDISLVAGTDYAGGLPVHDLGVPDAQPMQAQVADIPNLFTVVGSNADFEYQLPAAPAFFVGRKDILARSKRLTDGTEGRGNVIVLNAQSGWGKSSLALRLAYQVQQAGGFSIVFDTRTASSPSYVSAALRRAIMDATAAGKLTLPANPSFASLQSTLTTLNAAYSQGATAPMLVFFDQFENVFRSSRLTQEFRDLSLGILEVKAPVLIGFSWKTDHFALAETYPYQLRDEIRNVAVVQNIAPFGPADVGTLLGRLAKASGTKLSTDLRTRIREYSQGLPWLLKKLASHILAQLQEGTSEETLLSEGLNIEELFRKDMDALQPQEIEALRLIAREAPVAVTEIVERVNPEVVQSLVDQRLVVKVGERLDTYWDTFREFLVTDKVAIEDTYILRQRPLATAGMLKYLVAHGGEANAVDIARELSLSLNGVFNVAKDLKLLGILVPKPGSILLAEQLRTTSPTEQMVQERVARSLRRHKVHSKLQEILFATPAEQITVDNLAKQIPPLFPAIDAADNTWRAYAFSFASWLDYCGLIQLRGQVLCIPSGPSKTRLLGRTGKTRRSTFPQTRPSVALELLRATLGRASSTTLTSSSKQKALTDLQVLGIFDENECVRDLAQANLLLDGNSTHSVLRPLLHEVPGGGAALALLEANASSRPEEVGLILKEAYGLPWADTTTRMAGSTFRSWAAIAGIGIKKVARRQ